MSAVCILQSTWLFSVVLSVGSRIQFLVKHLSKLCIVHLSAPLKFENKDFVSLLHSIILKYVLFSRLVGHFIVYLWSE